MMKQLMLAMAAVWLLLVSFPIFGLPYNQYAWMDGQPVDCDANTEIVLHLFTWLLWLTTVALAGWLLRTRQKLAFNFPTILLMAYLLVSALAVPRYLHLLAYEARLEKACATATKAQ